MVRGELASWVSWGSGRLLQAALHILSDWCPCPQWVGAFSFFFSLFLPLSSHQLPVNEQAVMSPSCLCGSLISSSWLVQPVDISRWIYFLLSLFLLPHFFSWTFPLSLLSSFFGSFVGVSAQTNNNDHASMSVSSSAWLLLPRASVLQAEVERNAC